MKILHALQEGVSIGLISLKANKLRSSLTILGVSIGVGVIVIIAALVTGIRSSIVEAFEDAGPNNFIVMRFDFTSVQIGGGNQRPAWWNNPRIQPEEAERLTRLSSIDEALYNFDFVTNMAVDAQLISSVPTTGADAGWNRYNQGEFTSGRNFTPEEVRQSKPLVVISTLLGEELFGSRDPVGRRIRLTTPASRGVTEAFTVVGVYKGADNVFAEAVTRFAILPHSSAMKRLKAPNSQASILVVPHDSILQANAMDQVTGEMRLIRRLRPNQNDDFNVISSAELLETLDTFISVFLLVMLALSSVGLLVGGIGVIGIMMISVTERTREIGIRKAVGARRKEILWQFLVESALLTFLGGATGMIGGGILAKLIATYSPIPASIPVWAVVTALGSAILTGVIFGLVPALRASRMDPVNALRFE